MGKILAACLFLAAQTYNVPPAVLVGIYQVEGGQVGQEVQNTNGTYDLGPMQINTWWLPQLSRLWGVQQDTARHWVRDDPCTNVGVAAWILRQNLNQTNDLTQAIGYYNSHTPQFGIAYRNKVIASMSRYGLIRSVDGR